MSHGSFAIASGRIALSPTRWHDFGDYCWAWRMKALLITFMLLVVPALQITASAQVVLDADGKPLPKEVAALIGRKFQALPIDPKLGDRSPVYPNLGAWRPTELQGTEAQLLRSKKWDADVRENHAGRIKQLKREESAEYLQGKVVCSVGGGRGWRNSKYVIETVFRRCSDDSFEILDAIVLPKNFGWVFTHQILPRNAPEGEYLRRKELDLLKSPGRAFLPSKFFRTSYCPYYQEHFIAVDANGGRGYEVDREAGKFVRSHDPEMWASNPNEFCGAIQ